MFDCVLPQILGNITAALSSVASGMKTSARILPGLEEARDGQLASFLRYSGNLASRLGDGELLGGQPRGGQQADAAQGSSRLGRSFRPGVLTGDLKKSQIQEALYFKVTALAPSNNWMSKDHSEEEATKVEI